MEERWYSCLERRTMKFTHVLSILCVGIIAPYMIASEATDIEQAYKKELTKVKQADTKTAKDKKAQATKSAKEKTAKKTTTNKKITTHKKATTQKQKSKKITAKDKTVKATKTEKKAAPSKKQPTKSTATDKKANTQQQKRVTRQETTPDVEPVEKVTHRAPDIQTLEPRTVIVGEEFTISRPASPNFGRTWKLHKALPVQIEMVGEAAFIPADHPGRNEGSLVFTFKATRPGLTTIEFEKIYPPELRDKKPMKVRIVPVEIKEASAQ